MSRAGPVHSVTPAELTHPSETDNPGAAACMESVYAQSDEAPMPDHAPKVVLIKCADARLPPILELLLVNASGGVYFKIANAVPLIPPFVVYWCFQRPISVFAGFLLKCASGIRGPY